MTISREVAATLAAGAVDAARIAELAILRTVTRYLSADLDAPDWTIRKLADLQALRREVVDVLAQFDADAAAAATSAIERAYATGVTAAVKDLPVLDPRRPAMTRAVATLGMDAVSSLTGLAPLILRQVDDVYRQAVAAAAPAVTGGAVTRVQATQTVLNHFADRGVTSFVDRAGRRWGLDSYSEMAVRTAAGQAAQIGHRQTLSENGWDLIYVIPGPRACPDCDEWAGRVLSLSGTHPDHPSLAAATSSGHLFGPNCRCGEAAYQEGVSDLTVDRPDPGEYQAGQRQREIERHIRDWKRREATAIDPADEARAKSKIRYWQAEMRQHLTDNPTLARQPGREQIRRAH